MNGNTEEFVTFRVKEAMEQRLNHQFLVGLTGIIGAGKSTIANALVELGKQQGITVHNIDLDTLAHDVLFFRPEPAYVSLRAALQEKFKLSEWSRHSLGQLVFSDFKALQELNEAMRTPLHTRLRATLLGKQGVILLNGALLVETGWYSLVNNRFLVLDVPPALQLERLLQRGCSLDQAERRISAQYTTASKVREIQASIAREAFGSYNVVDTTSAVPITAQHLSSKLNDWFSLGKKIL